MKGPTWLTDGIYIPVIYHQHTIMHRESRLNSHLLPASCFVSCEMCSRSPPPYATAKEWYHRVLVFQIESRRATLADSTAWHFVANLMFRYTDLSGPASGFVPFSDFSFNVALGFAFRLIVASLQRQDGTFTMSQTTSRLRKTRDRRHMSWHLMRCDAKDSVGSIRSA